VVELDFTVLIVDGSLVSVVVDSHSVCRSLEKKQLIAYHRFDGGKCGDLKSFAILTLWF
jgi:hypothetical protein